MKMSVPVCDTCGKIFSRNDNLKRHMIIHIQPKSFTCIHCDRKFSYSDKLKRHLKFHCSTSHSSNISKTEIENQQSADLPSLKINRLSENNRCKQTIVNDKKYLMVPEINVSKHVPSEKQLSEFDCQISEVLNSSRPEYEKVRIYHEILQKKLNLENYNLPWIKPPMEPPAVDDDDDDSKHNLYEELAVKALPISLKTHAQSLLQILKRRPEVIRWNEQGEMILHGKTRKNTNLLDLLRLIFTTTNKTNVPGKEDFLNALQEINAPASFIKNPNLNTYDVKLEEPVKSKKRKSVQTKWLKYK